ncbi:MAG: putative metal-binding motif-containing protein, partial [Candidatus Micrarchaeota archaeon]|nr:putative metal-binding motif-containing protein [Candidatus Micrarchaeota archaeon]
DSSADVHPGANETCDNIDNDCNANTLDGISESWYNEPTECGVGECARTGVFICQEGSQFSTCVPGIATEETCDSRDNNCDGTIDEISRNCSDSNNGICGLGAELCSGGEWSGCPLPQQEMCNGKDDDCDGAVDEESKVQFIFNQWQNWGKQAKIDALGIAPVVYADSIEGSPFASGSFIPVNMTYSTTNKNVPGLAIDSGNGYFDVWLWGKNDGITKKAVNVTIYLDGITVKSISNIQGAPYERNRDGKAKFGVPGQDQVWVQSGNQISFVATVSSANDAFRVYYTKSECTSNDADNDGMPDYLDICPSSKTDAAIILDSNNHFADINMNGIFETKKKVENVTCKNVTYKIGKKTYTKLECHKDYIWVIANSDYTLQDTFGCTCSDILAKKPGSDRGQLKYGCAKGTLDDWITEVGYDWGNKKR